MWLYMFCPQENVWLHASGSQNSNTAAAIAGGNTFQVTYTTDATCLHILWILLDCTVVIQANFNTLTLFQTFWL